MNVITNISNNEGLYNFIKSANYIKYFNYVLYFKYILGSNYLLYSNYIRSCLNSGTLESIMSFNDFLSSIYSLTNNELDDYYELVYSELVDNKNEVEDKNEWFI